MIIQCGQCRTKFRIDDSKIKDTGVKVRCARCRHVFAVSNEQQEASQQAGFGAIFDRNAALMDEAHPFEPFVPHDESGGISLAAGNREESALTIDPTIFDLPLEVPLPSAEPADDFGQYNPEDDLEPPTTEAETSAPASGIGFGGFDFGNLPEYDESVSPATAQTVESAAADTAAPVDFSLRFDDFAEPGLSLEPDAAGEAGARATDQPFNLGEIDFGDDLASLSSQQVNPDNVMGGLDFDFGHLDAPQESSSTFAPAAPWVAPVVHTAAEQEPKPSSELTSDKIGVWGPWSLAVPAQPGSADNIKLKPLEIPEQYKQSHLTTLLFSAMAFVGMLMAIYNSTPHTQEETVTTSGPAAAAVQAGQAVGSISLGGVDAAFVNNKSAGELLVITGNAVNNFGEPRAALQIKGIVYGENDRVVASKNAYCGNVLTRDQLASMPLESIEAAMLNQFGSAQDNRDVPPGKAIPCMVVLSKLPEDAKNYGAVSAGSQPATGKQQKPRQSAE